MGQQLIIGIGTGRSGTTSLSAFLNTQSQTCVLHEGRLDPRSLATPFAWENDTENILSWIRQLFERYPTHQWVGDIGMYYINYADEILTRYPNTRFICMERPSEEVVISYQKWTPKKNHWMVHDGTIWKHDLRWDPAYPKFEAQSKEDALRMYCKFYAAQVRVLKEKYPEAVMIVSLDEFNHESGRDSILDFINYAGPRRVNAAFNKNKVSEKHAVSYGKRIMDSLVNVKRMIIGRPGQRKVFSKSGKNQ